MPGIASAATAVRHRSRGGGHQPPSASAPAASCCPTTRRSSSPSSSARSSRSIPGRIDLGLGRAPGTDRLTTRALRRDPAAAAEQFPDDVLELLGYFRAPGPGQAVRAVPGAGLDVPIWLLGSSLYSAELAAHDGPAVRLRVALRAGLPAGGARRLPPRLQALGRLDAPYAMAAINVSPRTPTTKRAGCSPRCSSSSSTCGAACRDVCRIPTR